MRSHRSDWHGPAPGDSLRRMLVPGLLAKAKCS